MRFGTCVGSDDTNLIPLLERLDDHRLLDFVELYLKKTSSFSEVYQWFHLNNKRDEYFIHRIQVASDDKNGIDMESIKNASVYGKEFSTGDIIFDAGYNEGLLSQVKEVDKSSYSNKFCPENMPYSTVYGKTILSMPHEFETEKFCLDFSHAWITAKQLGRDPKQLIKEFIDKKPKHFHLTDTDGIKDHLPMGEGEIDLEYIFLMLPANSYVTIETDNIGENREKRIEQDLRYVIKKYEDWSRNTGKGRVY